MSCLSDHGRQCIDFKEDMMLTLGPSSSKGALASFSSHLSTLCMQALLAEGCSAASVPKALAALERGPIASFSHTALSALPETVLS